METAQWYREFGEREARGVSPAYERLCAAVAADGALLSRLAELPEPKRQPNLLFGAVRYLDGPVLDPAAFLAWTTVHFDEVAAVMRQRRTQTNEAGRCAALLPVLAGLPQPLALVEVGASAGLCLYPDRYAYRYGDTVVGESTVLLECAVDGPVPVPSLRPEVVWRAGLDLNPLDVHDDDDLRWLESLVWPEQEHRRARLHAAALVARAEPAHLVRGDLTTDLPALVDEAPAGATVVVFHTSAVAYVTDQAARESFVEAVRAMPVRWVSNEAPKVFRFTTALDEPRLRTVVCLDGVPVARATPHGDRLWWLA